MSTHWANGTSLGWQGKDLDFEIEVGNTFGKGKNRYCWSAYWRDQLVGRGYPRTKLGMVLALRLAARRWRIATRKGRAA